MLLYEQKQLHLLLNMKSFVFVVSMNGLESRSYATRICETSRTVCERVQRSLCVVIEYNGFRLKRKK